MTHREDPTGDEPVGSNIAAVEQVDGLTASSSPSGDSASHQQAHPAPGTYQRSTMPEVMILGLAGIAFVVALFILLWSGFNDAIGSQAGLLVGSFVLTSGFLVMSWALYRRALSEQDTAVTLDRERRQETAALDRLNREEAAKQAQLERDEQSRQAGEHILLASEQDRKLHASARRTELSTRLNATLPRLCSEDSTMQAAAITELLFQIDDWSALINTEIDAEFAPEKRHILSEEGRRRRQELFNLAFNNEINNNEVLKTRCDGLVQRLHKDSNLRTLDDLDKTRLALGIQLIAQRGNNGGVVSTQAQFENVKFPTGLRLSGNLSGLNFRGAELPKANLQGADLRGCDLRDTNLQGADLRKTSLLGADLMSAHLENSNLRGSDLQKANLHKAVLRNADLRDTDLEGAYLVGADLQGANLQKANLRLANLQESHLQQTHLQQADLQQADLKNTSLASAKMDSANFQESRLQNSDLQQSDLRNANLQGADMKNVDLQWAKLQGANLHKANLCEAKALNSEFNEHTNYDSAMYNMSTIFPEGLSPITTRMVFIDEDGRPTEIREAELA